MLILSVLAFLTLAPILWMVQMSFRTSLALFEMPPSWTTGWTLQNYADILETNFQRNLGNSLLVSSATTLLSMLLGAPAAFAFSRYRFRRAGLMAFWILFARLALPIGFALPLFVIFLNLKLVNTFQGLVLVYLTFLVPMVIWILRPFFDSIPRDLEESAYVDGATPMQSFIRIILPLSAPGLSAVAVLTFIMAWIEFFYALIFTRGPNMTAPVAIVNFLNYAGWEWGKITAAGTVIMLPVIFFALLTHRYLISGLTAGAIRG